MIIWRREVRTIRLMRLKVLMIPLDPLLCLIAIFMVAFEWVWCRPYGRLMISFNEQLVQCFKLSYCINWLTILSEIHKKPTLLYFSSPIINFFAILCVFSKDGYIQIMQGNLSLKKVNEHTSYYSFFNILLHMQKKCLNAVYNLCFSVNCT